MTGTVARLVRRLPRRRRGVSRHVLVQFTRQLRVFVKGGIPLSQAMRIISDETSDSVLRSALVLILDDLERGEQLSGCLERRHDLFPEYFIGLIRAAEATGAFVETLESLTAYQTRLIDTRSKITSALTYPAIVMSMALVTVGILAGFVIPRFRPLFEELGSTLPLPTRLLLGSTSLVTGNLPALSLFGFALVVLATLAIRSRRGRRAIDTWVLRIPIIGILTRYVMLERFCTILAATVRSGLPVTSGMRLSTQTISNSRLHDLLVRAGRDMSMGIGFTAALDRTGLFPGAARQMLRVGEETGALVEQVSAASEFFDAEVDVRLRKFTSLFEPLLILFVGLVVGFVAVALVSAMYGVLDGVREIS